MKRFRVNSRPSGRFGIIAPHSLNITNGYRGGTRF